MTRATLLHVLDHPAALGPAEVRELEQLAQAFPYCQTAHLLLAKAAHDHGTMLAGQRLRRAATYAADRALLRQLIEQVAPMVVEEPPVLPEVVAPVTAVAAPVAEPLTPVAELEVPVVSVEPKAAEPVAEPVITTLEAEAIAAKNNTQLFDKQHVIDEIAETALTTEEALLDPTPPSEETAESKELITTEQADSALLLDVEGTNIPVADAAPETLLEVPEAEPVAEEDLPAQAPAIRPPVEAGEARFEFGLAEPPPPAAPTYELPGLVDEWAAAATILSLGSLEPLSAISAFAGADSASAAAVFTPAAFTGDDLVGYGFGESSRLGFSMQLLHLLTDHAEAAELASGPGATAQPPAAPLPPPGYYFEPDPLLLDHWATHCPPPPALPSSLDLINNFLRRQPRLTRPAMLPPAANPQADLSVRSTRPEAELVSESLARILVRQGKTARAIEIYEKLMVKQPEKKAYFAAQIQQLQPPA